MVLREELAKAGYEVISSERVKSLGTMSGSRCCRFQWSGDHPGGA